MIINLFFIKNSLFNNFLFQHIMYYLLITSILLSETKYKESMIMLIFLGWYVFINKFKKIRQILY